MAIVSNLVPNKLHPVTGEDLRPTVVTTWQDGSAMSDALCGGLYNKDTEPTSPTFGSYFKWNAAGPWPVSRLTTITQAKFQKLVNDFGSNSAIIVLDKTLAITGNMTIPSNVKIRFSPGSTFNISTGITLTINSIIDEDHKQLFSGLGIPLLVNPTVKASWYGVISNGAASESTLVNKIMTNAPLGSTVEFISNSTIQLTAAITISKSLVLNMNGATFDIQHAGLTGVTINADDITVNDLKLIAPSTMENCVTIAAGKVGTTLNRPIISGGLVGINGNGKTHNTIILQPKISGLSTGILIRTSNNINIVRPIINDYSGNGDTAIKITSSEKTVASATIADSLITTTASHSFTIGDKIRFYGGTLPTGISVNKSYFVSDTGFTTTAFKVKEYLGGPDVTFSGADGTGITIVFSVSRNVKITDGSFKNNRCALWLMYADNSKIKGNDITDGTPIQVENSWENVVSNNSVEDGIDIGINFHKNSSFNIISFNHANRNANCGIGITGDIASGIANNNYNIVANNECRYNRSSVSFPSITGDGIQANSTGIGNKIVNNVCNFNEGTGISIFKGQTFAFVGSNHCVSNTRHGVDAANDGTKISDNYCYNNTVDGIKLGVDASYVQVLDNQCTNNGSYGIELGATSAFCEIRHNQLRLNTTADILKNGIGSNVYSEYYAIADGTSAQYITGSGTKVTFPTVPTAADYVDRTTAQSVAGAKTLTGVLTTVSIQPTADITSNLGTSVLRWLSAFISTINANGMLRLRSSTSSTIFQQTADSDSFGGFMGATKEFFVQAPGAIPTNTNERLQVYGNVKITVIAALATPATLFLVSDSGVIKSRTPAQVLSDIGIVQGAFTASGDGVATTINIPHGLGSTPTAPIVVAGNAAAAGITWVSADATNIIVHYSVAPASGTNNLTFNISYKK